MKLEHTHIQFHAVQHKRNRCHLIGSFPKSGLSVTAENPAAISIRNNQRSKNTFQLADKCYSYITVCSNRVWTQCQAENIKLQNPYMIKCCGPPLRGWAQLCFLMPGLESLGEKPSPDRADHGAKCSLSPTHLLAQVRWAKKPARLLLTWLASSVSKFRPF